ncbi:hypothetical protein GCM10011506_00190 [Marivirga lumbricoides]|uniref:Lipoprotein n=1 Tax=Marivirga lumbricoides TaxID=1046115 RepID=A0ABQ1L6C1_9BACT|nr:hypothetical protein GCM10011506_00190 [Marivirga lumbricoides]
MKYILIILLLISFVSCSEFDEDNKDLCVSVFCGEIDANQVNFTVYNNTNIDFDIFIWDVGGTKDTVELFSLKQYTCWYNYDSLNTAYIYAYGESGNNKYALDTLMMDQDFVRNLTKGNYALEIYRDGSSGNLSHLLIDNYSGECREFK